MGSLLTSLYRSFRFLSKKIVCKKPNWFSVLIYIQSHSPKIIETTKRKALITSVLCPKRVSVVTIETHDSFHKTHNPVYALYRTQHTLLFNIILGHHKILHLNPYILVPAHFVGAMSLSSTRGYQVGFNNICNHLKKIKLLASSALYPKKISLVTIALIQC